MKMEQAEVVDGVEEPVATEPKDENTGAEAKKKKKNKKNKKKEVGGTG